MSWLDGDNNSAFCASGVEPSHLPILYPKKNMSLMLDSETNSM